MSEERPQHSRAPAEGSDEDVEANEAQRAGKPTRGHRKLSSPCIPRSRPKVTTRRYTHLAPSRLGMTIKQRTG